MPDVTEQDRRRMVRILQEEWVPGVTEHGVLTPTRLDDALAEAIADRLILAGIVPKCSEDGAHG